MADLKRWFKVWTSVLDDLHFQEMTLEDIGRWTLLGAAIASVGSRGRLTSPREARRLREVLRVESLEALACCLKRLPNVHVEEGQNRHGEFTVTMEKWTKYQEDSTQAARARASRAKRREEEIDEKITSSSVPAIAGSARKTKVIEGNPNGSGAQTTPGSVAFDAYASAYAKRYGVQPVRNRKANSIFKHLSESIPAEEVPAVAAFYVTLDDTLYVRAKHPVDLLKRDAEKIRTEWATRDSRPDLAGGNQGPAGDLLAEFGRLYEGKIGSPYVGTAARDLTLLEGLLAVKGTNGSPGFTVQTLKRMMAGFFRFPPQMVRDKDRFDIPMFKVSFPELTRMLQRADI